METATPPPSRVGGGSNHPWCSSASKPGRAQRSLYPEGSPKKRCKMLKTNTFPADAQPPGEKCELTLHDEFGFDKCYRPFVLTIESLSLFLRPSEQAEALRPKKLWVYDKKVGIATAARRAAASLPYAPRLTNLSYIQKLSET